MRFFTFILLCFLGTFFGCGSQKPKKKAVYGPEYQKRIADYRRNRQQVISLAGFWQEYKRTEIKNRMAARAMEFSDTLKISIREDSLTRFFDLHSRISGGQLTLQRDGYHLGNGQVFASIKRQGDTLIMANKNSTSFLRKVPGFYVKPFVQEEINVNEELNNEFIALSLVNSHWKIYKKSDKDFNDEKKYLRNFQISEIDGASFFKGNATFANSKKSTKHEVRFYLAHNEIEIILGEQKVNYEIVQFENELMTLKREGALLFFKNLTK